MADVTVIVLMVAILLLVGFGVFSLVSISKQIRRMIELMEYLFGYGMDKAQPLASLFSLDKIRDLLDHPDCGIQAASEGRRRLEEQLHDIQSLLKERLPQRTD